MEQYDLVKRLITAMSILHEAHDHHGQHTADLARRLAEVCGLPAYQAGLLETGAHLHDIGKLFLDKTLLNAQRKLEPHEFDQVKTHTTLGWAAVDQAGYEPVICSIIRSHHERYDGNGYPDGLVAEAIPFEARIVRITDTYAALISPRSYRTAYSPAFAKSYIQAGKGTEFDASLVDLFFAQVVTDG